MVHGRLQAEQRSEGHAIGAEGDAHAGFVERAVGVAVRESIAETLFVETARLRPAACEVGLHAGPQVGFRQAFDEIGRCDLDVLQTMMQRIAAAREGLDTIENALERGVADGMDHELDAGLVALLEQRTERVGLVKRSAARVGCIAVRLAQIRRARAQRTVDEELDAEDTQPIVAEVGLDTALTQRVQSVRRQ